MPIAGVIWSALSVMQKTVKGNVMHLRQLISSASLALVATLSATSAQAYSQLVVFGDSLSDQGSAAAMLGGLLPSTPYFDGRFTNGPVAVETMALQLGLALDDRAVGGALTGAGNQFSFLNPALPGIATQVATYTAVKTAGGESLDANALYMVWGGGNDFLSALSSNNYAAIPAASVNAISNIRDEVANLYAAGARDFFMPTLADFAFTYAGVNASSTQQALLSGMTASFNAGLQLALNQLGAAHADLHIQYFDTNTFLVGLRAQMLASGGDLLDRCWSGSYGGSAATPSASLCANPDQYFLFDTVHPTAFVHNALGNAFAAAAVPEPEALSLALVGMLALWGVNRKRVCV
jgi:phospholipase/lecithinase/hemolysin